MSMGEEKNTLKTLKINGEISLPAELSLNDFCKLFNRFQDENGLGFNGFITDGKKSDEQ